MREERSANEYFPEEYGDLILDPHHLYKKSGVPIITALRSWGDMDLPWSC